MKKKTNWANATVKIGGLIFKILCVEQLFSAGGIELDGSMHYAQQEIRIKLGMGKEYTRQVVLHEILHGVLISVGCEMDTPLTEGPLDALGNGLLGVQIRWDNGRWEPLIILEGIK
jgi:hypothetical protein